MKKLEKYLEKQLKSVDYLLRKPANTYRTITFHRLRVRIKKLHSLLSFLNYCFDDFKMKKIFKPLDQVFHQAGKVRELRIEEVELEKYFSNSLAGYKTSLKKDQRKAQEVFFSILDETDPALLKKTKEYLKPYIKKIKRQSIKNYIKKNRNEIKEIVKQGLSQNKKIHVLRKQLKNLQYIQKGAGVNNKNELIPKSDILSDLLGKWHDYRIIIKHLENFNSKKIKTAEKRALEKIQLNFTSKSAFLLTRVSDKLGY